MMHKYVEIVNFKAVRANTSLQFNDIMANSTEWGKYNFYPNNGVVGLIISEDARGPEGILYVLQCGKKLFVPILPFGVQYITESEFKRRLHENSLVGKDVWKRNDYSVTNDILNYLDNMSRRQK